MDIKEGQLGPEISYELKFEDMKLQFKLSRKGGLGDEQGMYASVPAGAVLDMLMEGLEKLIPGDQKQMFALASSFLKAQLPK